MRNLTWRGRRLEWRPNSISRLRASVRDGSLRDTEGRIPRLALVLSTAETTCGVTDYCHFLAQALETVGRETLVMNVPWRDRGWRKSLFDLRKRLKDAECDWAIVQFTHLMWSRRGFPLGVMLVAATVWTSRCRLAVVIHDPSGFSGKRVRDGLRRSAQFVIMRLLAKHAERTFVTIDEKHIPWLRDGDMKKVQFVPVGTNIPVVDCGGISRRDPFTIAIFGVTDSRFRNEASAIVGVLKAATSQPGSFTSPCVRVFGRGASRVGDFMRHELDGVATVVASDIVSAEEVSRNLSSSDVLLFLRGELSSRRTSAIAAIAHGLPVVGTEGPETAWPIIEAGVVLNPGNRPEALASSLLRIAGDPVWAAELRRRSQTAYRRYFSWQTIACQIAEGISSPR